MIENEIITLSFNVFAGKIDIDEVNSKINEYAREGFTVMNSYRDENIFVIYMMPE